MEKHIFKKITNVKQVNIYIDYDIKNDGIICNNHKTFQYIWGSQTATTDLKSKGVKQLAPGKWFIPLKLFNERATFIGNKYSRIIDTLNIHNEINKMYEEQE